MPMEGVSYNAFCRDNHGQVLPGIIEIKGNKVTAKCLNSVLECIESPDAIRREELCCHAQNPIS